MYFRKAIAHKLCSERPPETYYLSKEVALEMKWELKIIMKENLVCCSEDAKKLKAGRWPKISYKSVHSVKRCKNQPFLSSVF